MVVTASMDGYVRLWDSLDGTKKGEFDCGFLDEVCMYVCMYVCRVHMMARKKANLTVVC